MKSYGSFLLLLALVVPARAQVTVSGGVDVVSNYLWRGFALGSGPAVQPGVNVGFGEHLTFSVWGSAIPSNRVVNRAFDEVDFVAAFAAPLGRAGEVSLGAIAYVFPGIDDFSFARGVSPEVFAGFTANAPLSPSVTAYYDANLGDGLYASFGVGQGVDVAGLGFAVDGALGYNHSQFGAEPGLAHADVSLSAEVPMGGATVVPKVGYVRSFENTGLEDDTLLFGLRVAF